MEAGTVISTIRHIAAKTPAIFRGVPLVRMAAIKLRTMSITSVTPNPDKPEKNNFKNCYNLI
jgi:hypothetical protein